MTSAPPIHLVFADDFAMMRSLIRIFLQTDPQIIILGEAASGDTLMSLCETVQPAMVLMDYHMPGPGAPAVVRWLHDHYPETKIVVMSSQAAAGHVQQMAQLQIDGYVLKDEMADCLLAAIHSVHTGTAWYSPVLRSCFTKAESPS